eukprot:TRINITY_DN3369_c0_g3_i1.p1 TRINITY_DN3369_c0_g3~~TRINITY_DN3369_c0_g3_i1.p1  ORF type:complete len:135 (-),score=15.32 TRINITY_DN3369_c0_g3_i1:79-483(-)
MSHLELGNGVFPDGGVGKGDGSDTKVPLDSIDGNGLEFLCEGGRGDRIRRVIEIKIGETGRGRRIASDHPSSTMSLILSILFECPTWNWGMAFFQMVVLVKETEVTPRYLLTASMAMASSSFVRAAEATGSEGS